MIKHRSSQRYVSRSQLALYVGCSVSTICRLERDGVLHPARLGSRIFFDLAEIDQIMKKRRETRAVPK